MLKLKGVPKKYQQQVIDFLITWHPLDSPVTVEFKNAFNLLLTQIPPKSVVKSLKSFTRYRLEKTLLSEVPCGAYFTLNEGHPLVRRERPHEDGTIRSWSYAYSSFLYYDPSTQVYLLKELEVKNA